MRHGLHSNLLLLAALAALGGCGGIEHRVAPPAQRQAMPVFEPPAWNSIEIIFLQTEIARVDQARRNDVRAAVAPFQSAGAGS